MTIIKNDKRNVPDIKDDILNPSFGTIKYWFISLLPARDGYFARNVPITIPTAIKNIYTVRLVRFSEIVLIFFMHIIPFTEMICMKIMF
jgi:hypothetical protein